MLFEDEMEPEGLHLKRYRDGKFYIDSNIYNNSIIIIGAQIYNWSIKDSSEIGEDSLSLLLSCKDEFEILLIGSGSEFKLWRPSQAIYLENNFSNYEWMKTESAFKIGATLLNEKRRVGLALLS